MSHKENNNIVHFQAEKILYDLERQIKDIGKIYGEQSIKDSLECVNRSRDILRGKLEDEDIFEIDIDSFFELHI